jgi:hypothetical protein
MWITELWRYPVKSMRGEQIGDAVAVTDDGVTGDRLAHVYGPRGVLTARTRPRLLGLAGTLGPDGEPLVNGAPWDGPATAAVVRDVAGVEARMAGYDGPERFDVLPLLVATDGAIEALGVDGRRLRPNIMLGGVPGLDERSWPGRALRIGEALIGVQSVRSRCIVTTIDPDTGEQDLDVLRRIHRQLAGTMALNCWVIRGGRIWVGQRADVVDVDVDPPLGGGWITGTPYRVAGTDREGKSDVTQATPSVR